MRTKIATAAALGGLALTAGLLVGPALAGPEDSGVVPVGREDRAASRHAALRQALDSLVADKTITQAQADKVAARLDRALPRRGEGVSRHHGVAALRAEVATVLGITPQELRAQREAGKTLAEIAAARGMSKDRLIDALVEAAQTRLAAAVSAGRLTPAQADAAKASLRERITAKVDRVAPGARGDRFRPDRSAPQG